MLGLVTKMKMLSASVSVVRNPKELDSVIKVSDALIDEGGLAPVVAFYQANDETRDVLQDVPALDELNIDQLSRLPNGTLGREYANYLQEHGFNPGDIIYQGRRTTLDRHVAGHLYETHDIWHVLTGFSTDEAGELGLQAFYAAQAPTPFPIVIIALGLLNTFFYAREDAGPRMDAISKGWIMGKRARQLFGRDWKTQWDRSLAELRNELQIAA